MMVSICHESISHGLLIVAQVYRHKVISLLLVIHDKTTFFPQGLKLFYILPYINKEIQLFQKT